MGAGHLTRGEPRRGADAPIRVQTRFERFPASLKGAFVLRGADGNPHAAQFEWGRVGRVPSGPAKPIPMEERQFDVAPVRDLFVPFEVGVSDLAPGWYRLEASVRVDGGRAWPFSSRSFAIPWPRGDVRRGSYPVGKRVRAGGSSFVVDRVELAGDSASVVWRTESHAGEGQEEGPPGDAVLVADGGVLDLLPPEEGSRLFVSRASGERRTVSYPMPKSVRSAAVVVRLRSGDESEPVGLSLV
jgi:hypothetical protein